MFLGKYERRSVKTFLGESAMAQYPAFRPGRNKKPSILSKNGAKERVTMPPDAFPAKQAQAAIEGRVKIADDQNLTFEATALNAFNQRSATAFNMAMNS